MSIGIFKPTHIEDNVIVLELKDSFRPNNVQGTFGFHSKSTLPAKCRSRRIVKNFNGETDDSQIISAKTNLSRSASTSAVVAHNILTLLSYVPLLGIIPCGVYFLHPLFNDNHWLHLESSKIKAAYYIRGLMAGLGFGWLNLLPDLGISGYRLLKA